MKKIPIPQPIDYSKFSRTNPLPEAFYGLPENVAYCSRCVISNQRPNSAVEYSHVKSSRKKTIRFDKDMICDACRFTEMKNKEIDWEDREKKLND